MGRRLITHSNFPIGHHYVVEKVYPNRPKISGRFAIRRDDNEGRVGLQKVLQDIG